MGEIVVRRKERKQDLGGRKITSIDLPPLLDDLCPAGPPPRWDRPWSNHQIMMSDRNTHENSQLGYANGGSS